MDFSGPFYSSVAFVRNMVPILKISELGDEDVGGKE